MLAPSCVIECELARAQGVQTNGPGFLYWSIHLSCSNRSSDGIDPNRLPLSCLTSSSTERVRERKSPFAHADAFSTTVAVLHAAARVTMRLRDPHARHSVLCAGRRRCVCRMPLCVPRASRRSYLEDRFFGRCTSLGLFLPEL